MLSQAQTARGAVALLVAALITCGGSAAEAGQRPERVQTATAAPAAVALLNILKRRPRGQVTAPPTSPVGAEAAAERSGEGAARLNPGLTAPLEMPVGRRPQRLLPTRV